MAWDAMKIAANGCLAGDYAAVVTGPVSKSALAAIGYEHPGQTEFFAAAWGGQPVMAFRGDHLRVALNALGWRCVDSIRMRARTVCWAMRNQN